MPAVLAATRLQSEQTELEELDRRLEELETELKRKSSWPMPKMMKQWLAFGSKANWGRAQGNVRLTPESDAECDSFECPPARRCRA
jgi:hypothetical protein